MHETCLIIINDPVMRSGPESNGDLWLSALGDPEFQKEGGGGREGGGGSRACEPKNIL